MKKKTIILVICIISLLLLTSWSYGGIDPRYMRILEHPHQEDLSPRQGGQSVDLILLIIPHGNSFYLVTWTKDSVPKGSSTCQNPVKREGEFKTNTVGKGK